MFYVLPRNSLLMTRMSIYSNSDFLFYICGTSQAKKGILFIKHFPQTSLNSIFFFDCLLTTGAKKQMRSLCSINETSSTLDNSVPWINKGKLNYIPWGKLLKKSILHVLEWSETNKNLDRLFANHVRFHDV